MYEHFDHAADIGVKGVGGSIEEAFAEAALGVMAVMCDVEKVVCEEYMDIECPFEDDENILFVDWLNAVIYEVSCKNMIFGRFEVTINEGVLKGRAYGERIDPERHDIAVEVKGATYTGLCVGKEGGSFFVQCVVDV